MGIFSLAVKGLWCGAIYLAIAILLDSTIPGRVTEFAFQPLGIMFTLLVFIFEIVFDYIKPPAWAP